MCAKSCLTFHIPMGHSLPGSYVHGILQAKILKWVTIYFWGSSPLRTWTCISCISCIGDWILGFFTPEPPEKPQRRGDCHKSGDKTKSRISMYTWNRCASSQTCRTFKAPDSACANRKHFELRRLSRTMDYTPSRTTIAIIIAIESCIYWKSLTPPEELWGAELVHRTQTVNSKRLLEKALVWTSFRGTSASTE